MSVLIGIDGSIASRAALDWGVARARAARTAITLRYVVDDEWGAVGASALAELRRNAEVLAQHELELAREGAGASPVTAEISVGPPMLTLAAEARDHELVVIGTHKVGVFHGLALGARGLQLAAMSPVPVAVVPVSSAGRRHGVAVGIGGEAGEDAAVRAAVDEANRYGEPLVLVQSSASSVLAGAHAISRARALAETLAPAAGVTEQRSSAAAGEALAIMSGQSVLTVVGRPTHPGAHGFRPLGRVTTELLLNLRGPVLVVPFPALPTTEWPERTTEPERSAGS